jgi:hypothetical protein
LLDGVALPVAGEPAKVWGKAPTGRWRGLRVAEAERSTGGGRRTSAADQATATRPSHWLARSAGDIPGRVRFEVTSPALGYLEVWAGPADQPDALRLREAGAADDWLPRRALRVPGRAFWRSALPVRFDRGSSAIELALPEGAAEALTAAAPGAPTVRGASGDLAAARLVACDDGEYQRTVRGKRRVGPLFDLEPRPFPSAAGARPPLADQSAAQGLALDGVRIGSKSTT